MKNYPKISIVTPTYNQGQYIEETIKSVLDQNYPNLEFIIMDGGSTDNTVEIIKKYEKHLTHWESKADKGQANAINKGLKLCTGEIFNWLNSDDYLAEGALNNIAKAFSELSVSAVAGRTIYFEDGVYQEPEQLANLSPRGLMFWEEGTVFVQPGLWLLRENIEAVGGLDESLHYSFDTDMIIRYLSLYPNVNYIKKDLVFFRLHDESKTVSQPERFFENKIQYINRTLNDPQFRHIHGLCEEWLITDNWSNVLKEQISSNDSKLKRFKTIISKLITEPKYKWNRKSFGALKRILVS
ncbi:glycosyltransferase family 2 protein [Formosa sp. 3Alg 14/1]|uniref:glycosyltransferase family 2 protein n=1 Tax=Formosa sp. 3Alg 14/1 TaxID=3382190 RepID=UPI0039BE87EE